MELDSRVLSCLLPSTTLLSGSSRLGLRHDSVRLPDTRTHVCTHVRTPYPYVSTYTCLVHGGTLSLFGTETVGFHRFCVHRTKPKTELTDTPLDP